MPTRRPTAKADKPEGKPVHRKIPGTLSRPCSVIAGKASLDPDAVTCPRCKRAK